MKRFVITTELQTKAMKDDFCKEYEKTYPKAVECLEEALIIVSKASLAFEDIKKEKRRKILTAGSMRFNCS